MNVSLKLREPKQQIMPKGPDFRWAPSIRGDLNGTQIRFNAPRHRPRRSNHLPVEPERRYSERDMFFRSMYDEVNDAEHGLKDHFEKLEYFYRAWAFNGPWFTGTVAELSLSFDFIKAVNFPTTMSLFHPRAFEQVIGEYLTFMYSYHLDFTREYIQEFDAPINWQSLDHLPVNAVRMESVPRDFSPHRTIEHLVFFPIADDVMAKLLFMPSRLLGLPRSELDKRASVETMYELMDKIIHSIELELSPEAKAQQAKALAGMADTSLVKDYPPFKWDKAPPEVEHKYLSDRAI